MAAKLFVLGSPSVKYKEALAVCRLPVDASEPDYDDDELMGLVEEGLGWVDDDVDDGYIELASELYGEPVKPPHPVSETLGPMGIVENHETQEKMKEALETEAFVNFAWCSLISAFVVVCCACGIL